MVGELADGFEDAPHEFCGCGRIFQGDVVGDGVEVGQRGVRPDYFSHRASRFLAWAWVAVGPSAIACSPRAMPLEKRHAPLH